MEGHGLGAIYIVPAHHLFVKFNNVILAYYSFLLEIGSCLPLPHSWPSTHYHGGGVLF